jgi:hypothetical protein
MGRKIINIGAIGNDGTGDSIRDSFRAVNDNFRELYSALGLGEKLTFIGLDDSPETYLGKENALVTVNSTTDGLAFKNLSAGVGIQLDFDTNPNQITVNSLFSDIQSDPSPNLGGPLSAASGGTRFPVGNLLDLSNGIEIIDAISRMNATHGVISAEAERLAVNKKYADTKISLAGIDTVDPATGTTNSTYGIMTGPLILSRDPTEADDVTYGGKIAATKSYVDNSGFSSLVNLYVATSGKDDRPGIGLDKQGRSLPYAFRSLEAALKRAEELVLEAPFEIGPYKKVLTYNNGQPCTLADIDDISATTGVGFSASFIFMKVDTVEIAAGGLNYLPGDILTVVGGTGTAARYEVLSVGPGGSQGRGPVTSIRQLTAGSYIALPTPAVGAATTTPGSSSGLKQGCTLNLTFRVASVTVGSGGSGYGLVSVRFVGGGGSGAFGTADVSNTGVINSITVTNGGGGFTSLPNVLVSLPRFRIFTNGYRTDFTGNPAESSPAANAQKDIREGLFLRGESSGALAQILAHDGTLDPEGREEFDVDIVSGSFQIGEVISYGDVTKNIQISVFVESGIYEENLPLRVPQNVAVIGDEFRRTIIRPKIGYDSSSPWAFLHFRRDPIIDGNAVATQLYGYHYLADSTQPVYPLIDNKGNYRSAATLIENNRAFLQEQVVGWQNFQIRNNTGVGGFTSSFEYNQELCYRDVGLLLDSMIFDLKWGGQNRTISAALKYKGSPSELGDPEIAITTQLSQTTAGIERLKVLITNILSNTPINTLYTLSGTEGSPVQPQIFDEGIVSEVGSKTVFDNLVDAVVDVISNSNSVNYPKDNGDMDVFLCNDAVILRAMTYQGHGGFAMVLDPEGQILAKSPYCQESAAFSRSKNIKTFAGGMFVDGFTGNQQFIIDSKDSNIVLRVSGLLRPPQTPCSFIVDDEIYRINYIRGYTFGVGTPTSTTGGYSTAQFILDELTPFTIPAGAVNCTFNGVTNTITVAGGHGLQVGAIIKFSNTGGALPTGIVAGRDYYVILSGFTAANFRVSENPSNNIPFEFTGNGSGTNRFTRVYEVLMPGNRSMLSNDFTQVADLGYGLIVTNGGLTEAVSMFTYYCQISYYALNGGQIRSVGGSSSHGNFALVAEGSDPLEVPTPTGFYTELAQPATVHASLTTTVNEKGDLAIYVNYTDFAPLPGSELEINHANNIVKYSVSTVQIDDVATKRIRLNLSTAGGLISAVPHGQAVTIRNNTFHALFGDTVNVATRPSTALVLNDSPFVYRVLEFSEYNNEYEFETYTITNINLGTGLITTDINHRQRVGYQVRFIKPGGSSLPNEIVAGASAIEGNVYYVVEVPAPNTFKIAATETGSALTFTGSFSGSPLVEPYGLSVAQLRENYDYIECVVYDPQPGLGSAQNITGAAGATVPNCFDRTAHGLTAGTPIRFSATSLPSNISSSEVYYVTNANLTADSFSVSSTHTIDSSFIGVTTGLTFLAGPTIGSITGGGPYFATISNISCLDTLQIGMTIYARPNIVNVDVVGNGTTCTYTFVSQAFPPYLLEQQITISGFSTGGYNGTFTVISCTNTTVTVANTTAGTDTGGTIAVVATGALAANTTIYSISAATNSIVITSATTPTGGTIVFNAEGAVFATSGGSGISYKVCAGEVGDTQFAIGNLGDADAQRIETGITQLLYYKFVYEGTSYEITNYQNSDSIGEEYALITVSPALTRPVTRFNNPVTLKAAAPGPSSITDGTLTIRISLTRVTSHDLLEIGTGSYADTNYPNEIYGPPVNSITSVPVYATQAENETGSLILRAQMQERGSGRTFFVTTDQFGNFNVGPFFRVDQGTGTVTFSASIALSQLDGLGFKRGTTISEFSTAMDEGRLDAVPTESAIRTYIGRRLGLDYSGAVVSPIDRIPSNKGFMALDGSLQWLGPSNMDMNNYKVVNLATPTLGTDAARLQDINISNLKDNDGTNLFNLSQIQTGQLLILDGTGNTIINATPTGEVTFDIQTGDSTTNVIRTIVSDGIIDNANISSSAAIAQSKLSLNAATTRANATGITQADRGLVSLNDAEFTVSPAGSGWVQLKDNGIGLGKLPQIGSDRVLGNSSSTTANVAEVTFSTIINEGLAVKKGQYQNSTGYLRRTNASVGNWTEDSHYGIVDHATAATANTLVFRDSNGDFSARNLNLEQLQIDSKVAVDSTAVGTGGFMQYFGFSGSAGLLIGDGTVDNTDKINYYNNRQHIFRNQDGASTFATINSSGITVSSVNNVTSISSGAEATAGTVTGRWTLVGTSRWQATYAADLAEYYEGDKEYPVGTVLVFDGDKEVTISTQKGDTKVAGVVSDSAAYSMYGACPGHKNLVALQGRVPCRVVGKIRKGDLLITGTAFGCAVSAGSDAKTGTVIGKALQDYDSDHIGTIEVAVGRN